MSGVDFSFVDVRDDNLKQRVGMPLSSLLCDKDEEKLEKARNTMKNLAKRVADNPELGRGLAGCGGSGW